MGIQWELKNVASQIQTLISCIWAWMCPAIFCVCYFVHFCLCLLLERRQEISCEPDSNSNFLREHHSWMCTAFFVILNIFVFLVEREQEIMTRNRNNWFRNKSQIQNCISRTIVQCVILFIYLFILGHFVFLADFINTVGRGWEKMVRSVGKGNRKMLQAKFKPSFPA